MKLKRKIAYLALQGFNRVPLIRLSGVWLKSYGFEIGNFYTITVTKDSILISKSIGD